MAQAASIPSVAVERPSPDVLLVRLSNDWRRGTAKAAEDVVRNELNNNRAVKLLEFNTSTLSGWDSRFVAFIGRCQQLSHAHHIQMRVEGLPDGVRRLLRLAGAVPGKQVQRAVAKQSRLSKVGEGAIRGWAGAVELFTFLGQNVVAVAKLLGRRAQFRWSDAYLVMNQTGPEALGIVAMINFLVGLILAFVGVLELGRFGATIYVADLVGIATVREMAPIMTGIILCGRTGAAFAAQLGTMKVNEEINALQTFGISPTEFLVLPRMIALMLMMPFLVVFANLISIAGGFCVAMRITDISSTVYISRTIDAIQLKTFVLGIVKGSFFGFLVAYTGCLRGMQSGYSAAAVGKATTQAVVAGISAIIASDGVFAVLCKALNI
jgi:phospholipid/cholesterol/gamma-HCH transport system permease protein